MIRRCPLACREDCFSIEDETCHSRAARSVRRRTQTMLVVRERPQYRSFQAGDLDTPNPRGTTHPDGSNTYNTEWLGHNDLQGRTVYQTTVHTQGVG